MFSDWQTINNGGARETLECMEKMGDIAERSDGSSNGYSVVSEFLPNSMGWRGEAARRVKKN